MSTNVLMVGCYLAHTSKFLLLVATLGLTGCGAVIPRVTPEFMAVVQQRAPKMGLTINGPEQLESIRNLYINRCSSCHSLNDPRDYNEPEWHEWMHKMKKKAKLTTEHEQNLLLFVLAARDLPIPE